MSKNFNIYYVLLYVYSYLYNLFKMIILYYLIILQSCYAINILLPVLRESFLYPYRKSFLFGTNYSFEFTNIIICK